MVACLAVHNKVGVLLPPAHASRPKKILFSIIFETLKTTFLYNFLLQLLFLLDAESAHHFSLNSLRMLIKIPGAKSILRSLFLVNDKRLERTVFGLQFRNPVGLAAGFDKNAKYVEVMEALGFGYVEIGTVTPKPQPGNDLPRLFRLKKDKAIINRMGFNNEGADIIAQRLQQLKDRKILIGGNIGKNKITPNEEAVNDYIVCFEKLFDVVDYFVVNVSSPNTPGLRALQDKDSLLQILGALQQINQAKPSPKPMLLKIAPDLTTAQIKEIVEIVLETKIAGIIATNTTISRESLITNNQVVTAMGAGGLSGAPLTKKSTEIIQLIHQYASRKINVIGVGGIMTEQDALDKINAGSDLIQLYTGFIYAGPRLVTQINKRLLV